MKHKRHCVVEYPNVITSSQYLSLASLPAETPEPSTLGKHQMCDVLKSGPTFELLPNSIFILNLCSLLLASFCELKYP